VRRGRAIGKAEEKYLNLFSKILGDFMKQIRVASAEIILLLCCVFSQAQQTVATNTNVAVPPLINFSGTLTEANGKPITITGTVAVTFSLYSEQTGGAALWMETQNVQTDSHGNYTVMLGSTSSTGLPAEIFVAGEAHWLGVQVQGQPEEQPRVLLVSAPYALKAGDAQTLGGLPASAFVLAAAPNGGAASNAATALTSATASPSLSSDTTSDVTTTGGTVGTIAAFSTATNIQNSLLTQTGTTAINVKGILNLPATGTATASAGKNSQPQTLVTSAFNSSTSAAVAQTFQWQAEPAGNDTSSPSGALHLLFGSGTSKPSETGLNIGSNGQITFATGQTFPGTGDGTITGVTAGTDLTGGGSGGSVTLNVDTTKIPQLNNPNTFTQAVTVNSGNPIGSVQANSTAGSGIVASTSFAGGDGVVGEVTATTGSTAGVLGLSASPTGVGVEGEATSSSNSASGIGVFGTTASPSGIGVSGQANSGDLSEGIGVYGTSSTISYGVGVLGTATGYGGAGGLFEGGPSGSTYQGGQGVSAYGGTDTGSSGIGAGAGGGFAGGDSTKGIAGDGADFQGGNGVIAGNGIIASAGSGTGTITYPVAGVAGIGPGPLTEIDGPGVFGNDAFLSSTGSAFLGEDIGVWGDVSQSGGSGSTPIGVVGTADNALAMLAENASATYPTLSAGNFSTSSTAPAFQAFTFSSGGFATIGGDGCSDTIGFQLGLQGMSSNCENYTLQGDTSGNTYLNASGSGKIVFRINNGSGPSPMTLNNNGSVTIGTLDVTTMLTKPGGSFKIDHPLDPANKYLYHSFVESPDMKNIYDGVASLDGNGEAVITLPDYFGALNRDFRYQLTTIGGFAPVYIAEEIQNNQFKIAGGKPGLKVSWQVTGTRQDAFANAHRIQAEVEKAPADRGHYLHPELFGAPATARIGYEAPSVLAPAGEKSSSASARASTARPRQLMRPNRPMPVLPKLPEIKTPPKPNVTATSR
jgi:trimeric autotransporter adhesin